MERDCIHTGDAFDVLPDLPAESVHACVTDPPYGLAFMGRDWDDFEPKEYQEWCEKWAREVKRVLKPGGHLLAFSGNRTHHRLFTGVEDAGFEIRDTVTWHYGSGFPKALDVSKAIDKAEGKKEERKTIRTVDSPDIRGNQAAGTGGYLGDEHEDRDRLKHEITAPATDAAKKWDGFKTGLKPATEYVVVARKPFDGATVDCVLDHGTGALNIDGTRIDTDGRPNITHGKETETRFRAGDGSDELPGSEYGGETTEGRYPSNVVFDETEAERLDREVGELETGGGHTSDNNYGEGTAFNGDDVETPGYEGGGGPSRYFYTSKASKSERTLDGQIDNAHPTVKPADLMEWLVTLVTAEGQTVLDPFAGSGTTCRAAKDLGRRFVGVERQAKWADVARVRVGLTPNDPSVVRGDDAQHGLEAYE